eukprot:CAMPEP_0172545028 /NCGR_PEP_ID=MMETSP1067-20121228/15061_1 /TAXON_ID=265564 ORGANISM="Thalassiosira punctigera, Strain Tpunct2005C2" /NCGR_SAMPLE_ID=MMETSP1067 /ASSEMBLY_ACC=CAM_ASM_000444 /LENGTH=51 /DNA_ID=CAMNT_0013331699 /DNA_START=20 /DNA_END=172 /DNA_ORIENTATION=-
MRLLSSQKIGASPCTCHKTPLVTSTASHRNVLRLRARRGIAASVGRATPLR